MGPIRERLLARATELGYRHGLFVLNAMHYGVAQARERMFLIGLRDERPSQPAPTSRERPPTVREVSVAFLGWASPATMASALPE